MNAWDYIVNLFVNVRSDFVEFLQGQGLSDAQVLLLDAIVGIALILMVVFPIVIVFIWLERRFIAWIQLRPGPNRCGPLGLLQPVADAIKVLFKEIIVVAKGDKLVLFIAPVVVFVSALMIFAVIPIGEDTLVVPGALTDIDVGLLYLVGISSLSVIAFFMAGWGSNNKYTLLGAMRAVAQMISYEVPMVLSLIGVVLIVGSMQITRIVGDQTIPFFLLQPLGFLIYIAGALAELNRSPMDQIEAESELTTGYFTEYSGMRFATFFLGEYIATLAIACIVTTVFLGGWKGPGLPMWFWFTFKVFAVFMGMLWLRATLVRVRIDQIMAFSWKFLLPVALVNIFVTAGEVLIWVEYMPGWKSFPWPFMFINWAIAAGLIVFWAKVFFKLGGGRIAVGEIRDRYRQGYGINPQAPVP